MKLWVFAVCHNERDMLPFWLRHYGPIADRILVWDDASDDGTAKILADHPKVVVNHWPHGNGLDEDQLLAFAHDQIKNPGITADWLAWVDIDEFITGLPEFLADAPDADVIVPRGYNMIHDGLPKDDGRQIWEIAPMGVPSPIYSKPVVFRRGADVHWKRGKHQLELCNPIVLQTHRIKLLHYRYLGAEYTRQKNARNYARCCLATGDKGCAWSCAPDYNGKDKEGSPAWAEFAASVSFNVFTGKSPEACWKDY